MVFQLDVVMLGVDDGVFKDPAGHIWKIATDAWRDTLLASDARRRIEHSGNVLE